LRAWANSFQAFDWEKALPNPEPLPDSEQNIAQIPDPEQTIAQTKQLPACLVSLHYLPKGTVFNVLKVL